MDVSPSKADYNSDEIHSSPPMKSMLSAQMESAEQPSSKTKKMDDGEDHGYSNECKRTITFCYP